MKSTSSEFYSAVSDDDLLYFRINVKDTVTIHDGARILITARSCDPGHCQRSCGGSATLHFYDGPISHLEIRLFLPRTIASAAWVKEIKALIDLAANWGWESLLGEGDRRTTNQGGQGVPKRWGLNHAQSWMTISVPGWRIPRRGADDMRL